MDLATIKLLSFSFSLKNSSFTFRFNILLIFSLLKYQNQNIPNKVNI